MSNKSISREVFNFIVLKVEQHARVEFVACDLGERCLPAATVIVLDEFNLFRP